MRFCVQCGAMNTEEARFCEKCGAPLAGAGAPAPQPPVEVPQVSSPQGMPQPATPVEIPPQGGMAEIPQPAWPAEVPPMQPGQGYTMQSGPALNQAPYMGAPGQSGAQPQGMGCVPAGQQPYGGQPAYGAPPPAPKKKPSIWVWLGPVLGVVLVGIVLLVLWLTGVLGGGAKDATSSSAATDSNPRGGISSSRAVGGATPAQAESPYVQAIAGNIRPEEATVAFVSYIPIEDVRAAVDLAFEYCADNDLEMMYTSSSNGLESGIEHAITEAYQLIIVVNEPRGTFSQLEAQAKDAGSRVVYVDIVPPSTAQPDTTPPGEDTQVSEGNPLADYVLKAAEMGCGSIALVGTADMGDDQTAQWAKEAEALANEYGIGFANLLYSSIEDMNLQLEIMLASGESDCVMILNNYGYFDEIAEKAAAEGITVFDISI